MYEEKEELFFGKLKAGIKINRVKKLKEKLQALKMMLADLREKGINSKTLQKEIEKVKARIAKLS